MNGRRRRQGEVSRSRSSEEEKQLEVGIGSLSLPLYFGGVPHFDEPLTSQRKGWVAAGRLAFWA
jgi:hypothetical protein